METVHGKTVLVTGGATRLGRAVSIACGQARMNTAVHFHQAAKAADDTVSQIRTAGGIAASFDADLTIADNAEALLDKVSAEFGLPEYLVCCQAGYSETTLCGVGLKELLEEAALTGLSPLFLSRAWFRMGGGGAVVHLLDSRITDNDRNHAAYHLAKRMLHSIVRTLALEFAPRARVNAVAPGMVLPPDGADPKLLQKAAAATLLRRTGSPADIARTVLFLLESDFMTGQIIFVDGGRNLLGSVY